MINKKCPKCEKEKPVSLFSKCKTRPDGLRPHCKECRKKESAAYKKTENGHISKMYSSQRCNSKRRGHNMPSYSKEEFKHWLYKNNFQGFYKEWVDSGYLKSESPSCDREPLGLQRRE